MAKDYHKPDYVKNWQLQHPDDCKEYGKRAYQKNREDRLKYSKEYHQKIKSEVLSHYGQKCQVCGEDTFRLLCLDHVNGGGNEHVKSIGCGFGNGFYLWLKRNGYPNNPPLQVLCRKCNSNKQVINKER